MRHRAVRLRDLRARAEEILRNVLGQRLLPNTPEFFAAANCTAEICVEDRPPGKALDIGMGQGRNAIFLAQQGWDVTGFDPSPIGVRQAQATAHKLKLYLEALVVREEDFDLGHQRWDLIVMTYVRRLNAADAVRFQQR